MKFNFRFSALSEIAHSISEISSPLDTMFRRDGGATAFDSRRVGLTHWRNDAKKTVTIGWLGGRPHLRLKVSHADQRPERPRHLGK